MFHFISSRKKIFLALIDAFIITCAYLLAYFFIKSQGSLLFILNICAATIIYIGVMYVSGTYGHIIKYSSMREYMICFTSSICGCICMCCVSLFLSVVTDISLLGIKYHMLAGIIISTGAVSIRALLRHLSIRTNRPHQNENAKRVLIIGAGAAGNLVIKDIKKSYSHIYNVVGFIDDDKSKIGCTICGIKILGDRHKIKSVVEEKKVDIILFTIPSILSKDKKEIIDICHKTGRKLRILPGVNDLIKERGMVKSFRDLDVTDLLSRNPIKLNNTGIASFLAGEVVMVTGGGGSIGSELCRQIAKFSPRQLIIVEIYENNAYEVEYELNTYFPDVNVTVVIASIRDRARLEEIFKTYRPSMVFHAAAHKHVPLMESNAEEAVKNNIFGTLNTAECADKYGTKKFIMISTDKAVNPTNVMGATKRVCEMIVQGINKTSKTDFVAVRFGNVLGSNGSVIPLFQKQIREGGPLTVTHKEITRYFMTIAEASQLVLEAATFAEGGEIFVLDMGEPVKIYDLACQMIKLSGLVLGQDIEINITGLRPGEKLYEELLMNEEGLKNTPNNKIFIAKPMEIDIWELKEQLHSLSEVVGSTAVNDEVKRAIYEIVPTYKIYKKPTAVLKSGSAQVMVGPGVKTADATTVLSGAGS